MGTWSANIFDNDISLDLKSEYKHYLSKGFTNEEILEKIIDNYNGDDTEDEEYPIFWISLACIQWDLGRLSERVKTKAIDCIDNPKYLEIWEEDVKLLEKRKKRLQETREKLLSQQPPEKIIRKSPDNICPYTINDIIFYSRENGKFIIFCVKELQEDLGGKYARCFVLDYHKDVLPTIDEIKKITTRSEQILLLSWSGRSYKRLIKENRVGYICNYAVQNRKKIAGYGYAALNWENIEQWLSERFMNE